jgi:hypothetical protein
MTKFTKEELGIVSTQHYHQQHGIQSVRMIYKNSDFTDYALMTIFTFMTAQISYGEDNEITHFTKLLSIYMISAFYYRHGAKLHLPYVLRHPQEVFYSAYHKIRNIHIPTILSLAAMLIENKIVHSTPTIIDYHYSENIKNISIASIYLHLGLISSYRTVVLVDHLIKNDLVRNILKDSKWNKVLGKRNNSVFEIIHAYLTGVLAHLMSIAPWYFVMTTFKRSVLVYPLIMVLEKYLAPWRLLTVNSWYYRDHWLSHHSAFDFVYLHGPHHDAIPSGLLAVDESGFLESFLKSVIGYSNVYMSPLHIPKLFTKSIYMNINNHQYIPGIFPYARDNVANGHHHAQHHYLNLKPIGIAFENLNIPAISVEFDQQVNGFNPQTKIWDWFKRTTEHYEPINNNVASIALKSKNDGSAMLKIQFISICMFVLVELADFKDVEKKSAITGVIALAIVSFLYSIISTQRKIHWDFFKSPIVSPSRTSNEMSEAVNAETNTLSLNHH